MIIFDGTYKWSGKRETEGRPVSWWPSAYRLKIIDTSRRQANVIAMRPLLILITDTGKGGSAVNYAQELAKSVCRDFDLDIDKVRLIEYADTNPEKSRVAILTLVTTLGRENLYTVDWRDIQTNELELLKTYLPSPQTDISVKD